MHYLVSMNHTTRKDPYITLWRENNAGYCFQKAWAGVYKELEPGYHDKPPCLPVPVEELDKLFITAMRDGEERQMIPNAPAIWKILGVRMTKNGLVKLKTT